jgi:hypothetical protein
MVGVHHFDQILGLTCEAYPTSVGLLNGFLSLLCLWKNEAGAVLAIIAAVEFPDR